MEPMDIDSIVIVPDTPDRLAARDAKLKSSIDVPDSPDTQVVGDKVYSRNGIRKQFMRPPKSHNGSSSDAVLGKPISKISLVSKRHDHPSHNQSAKSETIQNGISYVSREGSVEGPTEHHCHGKRLLSDKGKQVVSTGGSQFVENGKNFQSAAQLHSQQSFADSRSVSRINNVTGNSNKVSAFDRGKGVESNAVMVSRINNGTGNSNKISAFDRGKGAESNAVTPPKVGQLVSSSFSSPRNPGQKRLVRNGCISPCNVAKAQKDLGKDKNGTIDEGPSCVSSSRTQTGVHSKAPVADTQASSVLNKGKGIIPLSNEESGGQNANERETVSINEILEEDDDGSPIGILSGRWRTTHNRSKKTHPSSSEVHQLRSTDRTCTVIHDTSPLPVRQRLRPNQLNEDWLQNTSDDSSSEEHHQLLSIDRTSTLIRDTSPLPLRERLRIKSRSNQHNEDQHQPIMDMNRKRQKQGSSSSSTQDARLQNTSDDSGIVFLGSSGDNNTTESRPTRTRRRINNNLARVTELDEVSSGVRANNGGSNGASSSNSVDPAMAARQMEADEILARELQEQLYHEDLGLRFGEIDVHERLDLPHENVPHAPPRRTRQASTARTASTANPSRPPRAWPNTRPNTNVSRALLQNRMRLRNRFPGRPRTITSSSREVNTLFPSEMDVEMRMTILEALEEYNDIGVDNSLLEIHREFNENDYEMLLGLDENNHRHSGASNRRINDLPQTTLQNDLEEACAVCLETPTTGDTIRHLPCFHKFHKDCIDPWLTRKSSCPVCKHSIT